ncbi:MAG: histidine kinase dimerization/phosphoacceptor domain-containing protein [Actinobacteria bacterium]|nr:histidine kinase dimerization/phosphoacceptor domain-containing protein [Actinomycetota bacterium]
MGPSAARNALVPGGALLLGVGLTAVVVLQDRRAVGPDAQPALDSAAAIIGLLLAYVLLGRFWESRRVRDLFLCAFLLLLGLSNALFAALPRALGNPTHPAASAAAGALAGSAFVAATWLPPWPWRRSRLRALVLLLVLAGVALSVAAAVDVPVTAAQWLASTLFLVGALGAGRAGRHDGLMTWLSAAGLLGVGSRIDFALSQRGLDRWATAGTLLRVLFYGALLVASALEIRSYWRRVAEVAVLEERRRIARDLHDGLAQELAFAATQSRALAERSEQPKRAQLIAAATERALDESRRRLRSG